MVFYLCNGAHGGASADACEPAGAYQEDVERNRHSNCMKAPSPCAQGWLRLNSGLLLAGLVDQIPHVCNCTCVAVQ